MKTTEIFNYNLICDLDYHEISDLIIKDIQDGDSIITNVFTPNAHGIISYDKYPSINKFCQQSKYILPDGQPLVWLSRFTPNKIKQRITGSDLFPVLFQKINNTNYKILFILSNDLLISRFNEISANSIYHIPPFLTMEDTHGLKVEAKSICKLILKNEVNFIFMGISEPKQGALSQLITNELQKKSYRKNCIFLFLGASYEFYFNIKKRAPKIYQKIGLEWFYRLLKEPKRLLKRYTVTNFKFIIKSAVWIIAQIFNNQKTNSENIKDEKGTQK